MKREEWAFIISLMVMLLMCSSYFFKKKSLYLAMQGSGIIFLMIAYILQREYFAMIGLCIGLVRSVVYLLYEYKDKHIPIFWPFLFSALGVACYFIINLGILGDAKLFDIIYLATLVLYMFTHRIRNLELVRYFVLLPTALSILYNILIKAVAFVAISYGFELCANVVAIIKYRLAKKKASGEKINEKN